MIRIKKRTKVLKYSLTLEKVASEILAYLLNIESSKESYSFGNKSSALSFNQKLNLLIDNQTITKEEKSKLEAFLNVRNQFMHNIDANTFVDAFSNIDGLETRVKKFYPKNFDKDLEKSLERCVDDLFKDGLKILVSDKGGRKKKMDTEVQARLYKEYFDKQGESIRINFKKFEEALMELEDDNVNKANLLEVLKLMKMEILASPLISLKIFD